MKTGTGWPSGEGARRALEGWRREEQEALGRLVHYESHRDESKTSARLIREARYRVEFVQEQIANWSRDLLPEQSAR